MIGFISYQNCNCTPASRFYTPGSKIEKIFHPKCSVFGPSSVIWVTIGVKSGDIGIKPGDIGIKSGEILIV